MTTISTGTNHGSIALTTVPNTVEIGETWTINESAIMYIRPKTITFTAQGLKPNTRYYPFFNNVDISGFCSIEDGQTSSIIMSNNIGSIVGNFYLPAATFTCGSHTFKLVDNVQVVNSTENNVTVNLPDPQYGSTEAIYEASGLLKQQQKMITTLTVIDAPPPPQTVLPVAPRPIVTPIVPVPVIPYPIPQIPEPILPKFVVNPPIPSPQNPAGTGCWSFYYDYNIINNAVQPNYTVPSQNPIPPNINTILSMGSGIINSNVLSSVKFIKSEKISESQWNHVFSITSPVTSKFRISIRNSSSRTPITSTFDISKRPSGLPDSAQYIPILPKGSTTPWVSRGNVCPSWDNSIVVDPFAGVIDPLAQSFLINPTTYPLGVFATSIAVYFKRVDQSCPAILELREMVNGYPGANILPGGKVILPGYTVSQSDNASIPTVFSFDQPVYLAPNKEFCFVLKSSSLGYDVWCSRFGDIDVVSGNVIDEQPVDGVLFKSANDSTWTATQYEDIKYDLNIAEFNNSLISTLSLQPQKSILPGPINLYYDTKQNLPLSFISTTENSNIVNIYSPMHGLLSGDVIYIGDFPVLPNNLINGLLYTDLKNTAFVATVIDEDNITVTVNTASKTGSLLVNESNQVINTNPIDNVFVSNYSSSIPFINENNNSLSVLPTIPTTLTTPTPPLSVSSSTFEFFTNILINEIMIDYIGTELPGTSIVETINSVSGNSSVLSFDQYTNTKTTEVDNNNKFISFDNPRLFVSGHNEPNIPSNDRTKNGLVSLELKSNDKHISPSIDLNGLSVIVKTYKIDNQANEINDIFDTYTESNDIKTKINDKTYNSEIGSGTGVANAKYKTKVVNLDNSSVNKRISVFLLGNCPSPAVMDVYVRLSNDANTHIDRDWTWVPLNNPKLSVLDYRVRFTNSINSSVMSEWYFEYESNESFTVFDIKVVMRSTNNSIIPKIYGIRTITNEV